MLNEVKHLQGNVIELGVAWGAITFPMSFIMTEMMKDKVIFACDTFEGMPFDDELKYGFHKQGDMKLFGSVFKQLYNIYTKNKLVNNITMIEGIIEETLYQQLNNRQFCFAFLDMDIYQSTSFGYKFLEDRIVKNGIIGFHDYDYLNCPGIKKVVDEELNKNKFKQIFNQDYCIFFERVE
jgi:hypothetical protein